MTQPAPEPIAEGRGRDRTDALLIVGATFGLQALTAVSGVITARILGVEGRGQLALVTALSLALSQFTLGSSLPIAIAKSLAERGIAGRDGLRRIARRRWPWALVPALLAGVAMALLTHDDLDAQGWGVVAAVVIATAQAVGFRILLGCLQGEVGRLVRSATIALVPQLLFTVALVVSLVLSWHWGIIEVLVSFLLASFAGLVLGFRALTPPTHRSEDLLDERELLVESRRTYVSSVRPLDSVGLDRLLVEGLLGNIALGLYSAAIAFANLCGVVGNAVSFIVLPRVAMSGDDPVAQAALIRRWVAFSGVVMAFVVVALEIVIAPAIRIAFGTEFVPAIDVARWLLVADGLLGLRKVLIAVLQGQGRGATASWIELVLTALLVLGVVIAHLADSLTGVGVAIAVVAALSCVATGLAVARPAARP